VLPVRSAKATHSNSAKVPLSFQIPNQSAFLSTNPTDSSECPLSSNPETANPDSHFQTNCSAIPVMVQLKSIHLKEGAEESECPLVQFRCRSTPTFVRIHSQKIALELLEKVVLLLQHHSQLLFHSRQTESSRFVIPVTPPMAENIWKASLAISRNGTLRTTSELL
jgi:hypothetical protein